MKLNLKDIIVVKSTFDVLNHVINPMITKTDDISQLNNMLKSLEKLVENIEKRKKMISNGEVKMYDKIISQLNKITDSLKEVNDINQLNTIQMYFEKLEYDIIEKKRGISIEHEEELW